MFGFDDPFGTKDKNDGRDKRRAFTKTQQNEILYQQNNKCAICQKPLDPRAIQYDHHKGWADKGRTVTRNGRALHPTCHAIKTHDDRLAKIEGKKKPVAAKKPVAKKKAPWDPFDLTLPEFNMPKGKDGFGGVF